MSAGYFSIIECAGGCGNLMPQRLVDAGKQYLWGHKNGCPKDGERASRRVAVKAIPAAKSGPAEPAVADTPSL